MSYQRDDDYPDRRLSQVNEATTRGRPDEAVTWSAAHALLGLTQYGYDTWESFGSERPQRTGFHRETGSVNMIDGRGSEVEPGQDDGRVSLPRGGPPQQGVWSQIETDSMSRRQHFSNSDYRTRPVLSLDQSRSRGEESAYGNGTGVQEDLAARVEPPMSHSAHTSKASSVFEGDNAEAVLGQDGGYAHSQRRGSVASIDSLISAAVEDIERQLAVIRRDHMVGTVANQYANAGDQVHGVFDDVERQQAGSNQNKHSRGVVDVDQWRTNRESARVPSQTVDDQRRRIDMVDVGTRRSTARRPANAAVERALVDYPQRAMDRAVTSNNLSERFSTQQ